nr:beta-ketoacyl synthase N-terminal-like domain-containing protein [Mariniflexile sp.]
MELKRVVVTGLGALTPIGNTKDDFWNGLISGKSGAAPITYFDTEKFKTKFACELKNFVATDFIDRKLASRMDRFTQYAMVAADEAIADAKLDLGAINKLRAGVIWGAGIGGLETFQDEVLNFAKRDGSPRVNPFFIPKMICDIAPGNIFIKY